MKETPLIIVRDGAIAQGFYDYLFVQWQKPPLGWRSRGPEEDGLPTKSSMHPLPCSDMEPDRHALGITM